MKLLLEGSLVALVLMCELVGVVALGRYTTAPETHLPRQESLLIVQSEVVVVVRLIGGWSGTDPPLPPPPATSSYGKLRGRTPPPSLKEEASSEKPRSTVEECTFGHT